MATTDFVLAIDIILSTGVIELPASIVHRWARGITTDFLPSMDQFEFVTTDVPGATDLATDEPEVTTEFIPSIGLISNLDSTDSHEITY